MLIVGSYLGAAKDPACVHNLRADPRAASRFQSNITAPAMYLATIVQQKVARSRC
nr:nitroreductase/quinone reductase family protein [Nocardia pseudovaccinii]